MKYSFLLVLTLLLLSCYASPAQIYTVTAYHQHKHKTSMGIRPYVGMCAGPRKHLGKIAIVKGIGRFPIKDTHPRGGIDIYMSSVSKCKKFGKKRLDVKIMRK
jgi:hypothetical protein